MRNLLSLLAICLLSMQAWAQNRTVTGNVTDEKGTPLAGVNITAKAPKGKRVAPVATDVNGHFSLSVPTGTEELEFSFVGYLNQLVSVSGQSDIIVKLASNAASLSEIVVVGYGTQRRKEVTGSLASVKGEAIAEKPVQSFEASLAGRAAGVQITVPTGVLNTPPVFRVRGTNSVSLSAYPLIVVDGVVAYTGDISLTSAAANPLASINPNDIESIDVAKDAAATAIYGSRAANGVVFITTKKGKTGKPKVNYDGWVGWTKTYRLPDLLNAAEYTDYKNEALNNARAVNASSYPAYYKFAKAADAKGDTIDTRWYDYVYRTGISHSHNVNVSGASENTNYYLSVGYTDQEGIIRKNDFKRINALINVDSRVNSFISVGGKLSYSNEKNLAAVSSGSLSTEAYGTAGLGRTVLVNAPNVSPYKNDGSYNLGPTYVGPMNNVLSSTAANTQIGFYNPTILIDKNRENNTVDHIQSNVYLQIKPLNWITLKTVYGIDNISVDNDEYYTPVHGPGQGDLGDAYGIFRKRTRWVWTNTAQLDYTFADTHNFSLLGGSEQQSSTVSGYGLKRYGVSDASYELIQAGWTSNDATSTAGAYGENYLLSAFGRLNYNYNKKYFVSVNARNDQYSALGIKKGTFWGASLGWEITKEDFWHSGGLDKVFSSFKVRGSYGKVGNLGGIGDYDAIAQFNSGLYGGAATLKFNYAADPNLTWETSKKTDVGFSFGVLNDRITGEVAYYKNDIDGLVLNVPMPASAGLPSGVLQNAGSMYNKGLELSINASPIQQKDFSWSTSFNITFNKNEVTSLGNSLSEIIYATGTTGTGENVNRTAPGYSLGYLWVVRTGGVDPTTGRRIFYDKAGSKITYQHVVASGQPQWAAEDGTQYVNPSDKTGLTKAVTQSFDAVMYKNTQPKQYGGWENTFRYKGFDLTALVTYQLGFYVSYGTNAGLHDQRYWNNTRDVLRRWKKAGDRTDMVRPLYGDNVSYGNTIPLDINVFKGDFIKLRNLSLGYSLPKSLVARGKITNARLYVSAQNLAMITSYPGPDPEVASNGNNAAGQGSDRNTAPNARVITVGLNVGF